MSVLFSMADEATQKETELKLSNPELFNQANEPQEPALSGSVSLAGAATYIPKLVARTGFHAALAGIGATEAIGESTGLNKQDWWHQYIPSHDSEFTKNLIGADQYFAPDPMTTHWSLKLLDRVASGVADFGVSGFNPYIFATAEAAKTNLEQLHEGKDLATAGQMALIAGASTLAFTKIAPGMAFKGFKAPVRVQGAATGAGIGVGIGGATNYANQQVLENAGYHEDAQAQDPFKAENIGMNALMGLIFGFYGVRFKSDVVDAALTANESHALEHPDGIEAADPKAENALVDNMHQAIKDLSEGREVTSQISFSPRPEIPPELIELAGNKMTRGDRKQLERKKADLEYKIKQIQKSDYSQAGQDLADEKLAAYQEEIAGKRIPARKVADTKKGIIRSAGDLAEQVRLEDMQPHNDMLTRINEQLAKDDEYRAAYAEISRIEQQHYRDNGFIYSPKLKQPFIDALHEEVPQFNEQPENKADSESSQIQTDETVNSSADSETGVNQEETRTADRKVNEPPEMDSARDALKRIDNSDIFTVVHDDGTIDSGTFEELMKKADEYNFDADKATEAAVNCGLRFGDFEKWQ